MGDSLFQMLLNRVRFYDKVEIRYDSFLREYSIFANRETVFRGSEARLIEWLTK